MISYEQLFHLVSQHYEESAGDKGEESKLLQSFTQRIDFLDSARLLITKALDSPRHAFFAFDCMYMIMVNRGSILDVKSLNDNLDFIFSALGENIDYIESRREILSKAAQAAAMTMRLLFEKNENMPDYFDEINDMLKCGEKQAIVALSIFEEFISAMQQTYQYQDNYDSLTKKNEFKDSYLASFVQISFLCIGESVVVNQKALELIRTAFRFVAGEDADPYSTVIYPQTFNEFFEGPDQLTILFSQVQTPDQDINALAFDVLEYYLRVSHMNFLSGNEMSKMILFSAQCMKDILLSIPPDSPHLADVCRCVDHICFQIQRLSISTKQLMEFLDILAEFSSNAFQGPFQVYPFIAKIWCRVASWTLPLDIDDEEHDRILSKRTIRMNPVYHPPDETDIQIAEKNKKHENADKLCGTVFDMLRLYIDRIFGTISLYPQQVLEEFITNGDGFFPPIWEISGLCFKEFHCHIVNLFKEKRDEFLGKCDEAGIINMFFLIMVIKSRASSLQSVSKKLSVKSYKKKEKEIYYVVFKFIQKSNCIVENCIAAHKDVAIELERIIIAFINEYQSKFFPKPPLAPPDPSKSTSLSAKEIEYITKCFRHFLIIIECSLERLRNDFRILYSYQNTSPLLISILMVVEQIEKHKDAKKYYITSEFLTDLYQRKIVIDYDESNVEELKRVRSRIFYLYALYIPNRRELLNFLSYFDQQFAIIIEQPPQPITVYQLFKDLIGVVRGTQNNSFLEKIITWFVFTHLEHINPIISMYSSCDSVLRAIVGLWIAFYNTARNANGPNVLTGTGIGLEIFKSSSMFAETIAQNCHSNASQIHIFFKLMHSCLTINVASYGVMRHFEDNSPDGLFVNFFAALTAFPFAQLIEKPKTIELILETFSSIIATSSEEIYRNKERIQIILGFTSNAFMQLQQKTWKISWNIVLQILNFVDLSHSYDLTPLFRPHFIYLFDSLINYSNSFVFDSAELIDALCVIDNSFVKQAFDNLVSLYDDNFKEAVSQALNKLINTKANDSKERARSFNRAMKCYSATLQTNQFFAAYFT